MEPYFTIEDFKFIGLFYTVTLPFVLSMLAQKDSIYEKDITKKQYVIYSVLYLVFFIVLTQGRTFLHNL